MLVGLNRFVRVVSGGKFSSQTLLDERANKVRGALNVLHQKVTDLENWQVAQAPDLREEYNRATQKFLQAVNAVPHNGTVAQFREACKRLEPVKKDMRITRDRANDLHRFVGGVLNEPRSVTNNGANLVNLNKEVAKGRDELKIAPATIDKVYAVAGVLQARSARLLQQANQLAANHGGAGNLQGDDLAAYNNATGMVQLLNDRANNLLTLAGNHPFTEAQIFKSKTVEVDAGIKLLNDAINRLGNPTPVALTNALNELTQRRVLLTNRNQNVRVRDPQSVLGPKDVGDKAKKKLVAFLQNNTADQYPIDSNKVNEREVVKATLERAIHGLTGPQKTTAQVSNLEARFEQIHVKALNDQQWNPIHKDVRYTKVDGTHLNLTSDITPASQLGDVFADMNGTGVCSHDGKSYRHAVNLASTKLTDSNGTEIFSALRHGINSAFDISPSRLKEMPDDELRQMIQDLLPVNDLAPGPNVPQRITNTIAQIRGNSKQAKQFTKQRVQTMKRQANLNRAQELVLAALVKNPAQLARAQAGQQATITINSISLVTPAWRPGADHDKEDVMLDDQMRAWQALDGQVIQVPIRNPNFNNNAPVHPVANPRNINANVLVSVVAFNFGVNVGAVSRNHIGAVASITGAWRNADQYNQQAMNQLIGSANQRRAAGNGLAGRVGDWLVQNPLHPNYGVVEQLAKQIAEIWDNETYAQEGNEPYKMVSRLAVLTHKMGGEPAFNCKSGKDRTGQLDVEAKILATQIEAQSGTVPQPNAKLDEKQKTNRMEMALNSGSLEMQQLNTGHMGFKLTGVTSLDRSYGTGEEDVRVKTFRGTSEFTDA
jgi:hypothetical protein